LIQFIKISLSDDLSAQVIELMKDSEETNELDERSDDGEEI
jgi:hypothetical protein